MCVCVCDEMKQKSTKCLVKVLRLCPSQVDLPPRPFYVRSPHSCGRNLLTLMPPYLPWTTGLQSLLKMRYEWRGGGGQHEMFFLLWDWGTGCEDGVFLLLLFFFFFLSFLSTPVIQLCHRVIAPLHPVILSAGPSVAPDIMNTITRVPPPTHPPTQPTNPSTLCFFWLPFVFTEP